MITALPISLLAGAALAAPHLSIQGRLANLAGIGVDGQYAVTVTLLAPDGTQLHKETLPNVVVSDGVFSARLGTETPLVASVFEAGPGATVSVAIAGEPVGAAVPLDSVPYAFYAPWADVAGSLQRRPSAPVACDGTAAGRMYFNTTDAMAYLCTGVAWTEYRGPIGPQGAKGDPGVAGAKGDTGAAGAKGDVGPQGAKGDAGDPGVAGAKGDVGPQGPKGDTGAQGLKGDPGIAGPKGDTGSVGPAGAVGPAGPKGDTGAQGPPGDPKATYTVWGRTTCAPGHTQLYKGSAANVVGTGGAGTPFCLHESYSSAGWVAWDGGMVWRANAASAGLRGQYANGANSFACAVCQGTTYVTWGNQTCAAGYSMLHDGWLAAVSGGWGNGWSPGGPICLDATDASGASWTNWDGTMIIKAVGSSGNNRVQYQNQTDVLCRVCY